MKSTHVFVRSRTILPHGYLRRSAVCFTLMFFFFGSVLISCSKPDNELHLDAFPEFLKSYAVTSPCDACSVLFETEWCDKEMTRNICGIRDPQHGSTFFVDIDFDRRIIKLKPVRDRRETILFYDPYHQGSKGMETNSHYRQARCPCGGNRFTLAAGVCCPEKKPGNMIQFVLAGKCTHCGSGRILFTN
jgi:nitrite reductase/ring-hydroxylating ferredoxin subunit